MAERFLDALRDHPLVADGAMGTQLYERGVLYTQNYEEICVSRPELIKSIHRDYLRAGAQVIETNTFGANRYRLAKFNLEKRVKELNEAGVRVAREAVAESTAASAWVAGNIGPTGMPTLKGLTARDLADIRGAFEEQAAGLASADLITVETMRSPEEMRLCIEAVRAVTDLPLVAMVSFDAFGTMADGTTPEVMADRLAQWGADVIGVNCGDGPAGVFDTLERMRGAGLPMAAMPNAGIPRRIEGRMLYMANPEYFGVYARRLIKLGVRLVGGCCGTTMDHIRRAANAARMHAHEGAAVSDGGAIRSTGAAQEPNDPTMSGAIEPAPGARVVPLSERSPFAAKLGKSFVVSVEVNPPAGMDPSKAVAAAKHLLANGVDVINIADGPRASARMGNLALAVKLIREGVETMLHVCCRDRNTLGLVGHVMAAHELGVRNLVIITGDPPKMGDYPDCTAVYDLDSIGLLRLVRGLNHGRDPGGKPLGGVTEFVLATGAEPAAMDYAREIARLKKKVEAGAELVMTQPVYDPAVLERFLDDVRALGHPRAGRHPAAGELPQRRVPPQRGARDAHARRGARAHAQGRQRAAGAQGGRRHRPRDAPGGAAPRGGRLRDAAARALGDGPRGHRRGEVIPRRP